MERARGTISAFQFFTMLFLSRTLTTVTYLSSYTEDVRLSDMLIVPILRIISGIVFVLPVYYFYKKNQSKNPIELATEKNEGLGKVISILYVLVFFYFTIVTLARLDVFTGTVVFPETDVDFMLVFMVALCCYGAYLGLEAIGRASVLSAVLVVPALFFILISLVEKVDFLNLTPVFYNGVTPVLKTAVDSLGQTVEFAVIATLMPRVRGEVKKGFFIWLISQTLLMGLMFFFACAVMGNYATTQLFPFHTLASLAEFTVFSRLDAVFTSVWIMCAFIKASMLIYLQTKILSSVFKTVGKVRLLVIIGVVTALVNLFISGRMTRFMAVDSSIIKIVLTGVTAFLIPLVTGFVGKERGRGNCKG